MLCCHKIHLSLSMFTIGGEEEEETSSTDETVEQSLQLQEEEYNREYAFEPELLTKKKDSIRYHKTNYATRKRVRQLSEENFERRRRNTIQCLTAGKNDEKNNQMRLKLKLFTMSKTRLAGYRIPRTGNKQNKMIKKNSRLATRRKFSNSNMNRPAPETQRSNSDDSMDPPAPVFASVHRPRQASISAIRNRHDNPQYQNRQTSQSQMQQQNNSNEIMPCSMEHGVSERAVFDNTNSSRVLLPSATGSTSCRLLGTIMEHPRFRMQHHLLAVPIPQPFHHQSPTTKLMQSTAFQTGRQPASNFNRSCPQTVQMHAPSSDVNNPSFHPAKVLREEPTPPPPTSRIPTCHQQHFNQISKSATNLLNDIYEKHLLNQTKFENIHQCSVAENSVLAPDGFPRASLPLENSKPNSSASAVSVNDGVCDSHITSFNKTQQFIKNQHLQFHPKLPQQSNPETADGKYFECSTHPLEPVIHLYETIDENKRKPTAPRPPTTLVSRMTRKRLAGRAQRVNKNWAVEKALRNDDSPQNQHFRDQNNYVSEYCSRPHKSHPSSLYQMQQQSKYSPPQTPYNPQERTNADGIGEKFTHNEHRYKEMHLERPPPVLPTLPPPPEHPYCCRLSINEEDMQNMTREIPIGSASEDEENTTLLLPLGSTGNSNITSTSTSIRRVEQFEEYTCPFVASSVSGPTSCSRPVPTNATAKYQYRNSQIDLMLETAQAVAAAVYYARAAQKLAQSAGTTGSGTIGASKSRSTDMSNSCRNGGFCGALQRAPPPLPNGLARRLANKENYCIGRVKVMLRVSNSIELQEENTVGEFNQHMVVDKKKRQVTLTDPTTSNTIASTSSQDRGPMVAAPKMFAFDSLFTADDQQTDLCASALSEVIPAVLEGSDGCLLSLGYPNSGQSKSMLGTVNAPNNDLGAIPCAISWLYKGINERRQKSGARFSVRVSALGVSATKPDSSAKDLLAAHATESNDSPGVYLRDDFLGGPTELRAPTAERAALFLDAALAGRPQSGLEPAMIFTLHVYQYSLSGKGGVAGGRSRLHLIDLGGCANRSGGLPLSGIGNILLAILSGQRHPPNKDHPLTPLLKDCLAPITCHVTILAHVSHTQSHADALTTIQLASRIHRMRRRKHRFGLPSDKVFAGVGNAGHQSGGGSSDGPDPSSSDLSADTVIYMGPCDDATDGEHPPVYLPSLCSGDNRCAMNKVLKGSAAEKPQSSLLSSSKIPAKKGVQKPQSPNVIQKHDSLKKVNNVIHSSAAVGLSLDQQIFSPVHSSSKNAASCSSSPKIVAGALRHGVSKGSNFPTPKSSPLRRPNIASNPESPMRKISEEQWIDGPRVSRSKVAEARHLLREINHVKQCETWIDGPKSTSTPSSKNLTTTNLQSTTALAPAPAAGYGFMDSHKKTMIRQWVENQSSHVFHGTTQSATSSPTHQPHHTQHQHQQQQIQDQLRSVTYHLTQFSRLKSGEDDQQTTMSSDAVNPLAVGLQQPTHHSNVLASENAVRCGLKLFSPSKEETDLASEKSGKSERFLQQTTVELQEEEDQDSGPSEVPPALPLIEPLGSLDISHESLHRIISRHVSRESLALTSQQNVQTIDCGLQVTEEEIARTMGCEHPLSALSHGDISIVSSFNIAGDAFSDCAIGERTRNQFDQLARLREIFTSQLAMAEVTPTFRINDAGSVYSEPAFRFNCGPGSVCSEPAYRPPSPRCRDCRQSLHHSRTSSQTSLPSLNGIMTIAGMEQYASLRHPDGASDPNLQKTDKPTTGGGCHPTNTVIALTHQTTKQDHCEDDEEVNEKTELLSKRPSIDSTEATAGDEKNFITELPIAQQKLHPQQPHHHYHPHQHHSPQQQTASHQLPLLPLSTTSEAYDSGHDSSTPRTSKHSGISRRAESGYHSVATARDSDESSFTSALSKVEPQNRITVNSMNKKKRQDKSLCNWLTKPFTCTYPETEGEISDF